MEEYEEPKDEDEEYVLALERYQRAVEFDRTQRELAIEDLKFIHAEDGQWTEDATEKRGDRPRLTIDRISGALDQIVGDQRETRTGPKVEPSTGADENGAEVRTGLLRDIEKQSRSDNIYDIAFYETLISGFGGWRIVTDYEGDDTFDQEILMKPVWSACSALYFDPQAEEYDKRDAKYGFYVTYMEREAFKEEYPDATDVDLSLPLYQRYWHDTRRDWFSDKGVRIAEYWCKKPRKKEIALLSDGRVIDLEEEKAVIDELAMRGIEVINTREVESYDIEMRLMNGAEWLEEPQEWAGKFIPLVPMYGRTAVVDAKHYTRGLVRKAKDPQRVYNYASSAAVESAALSPKDPIIMSTEQMKGHQKEWKTFNVKNPPVLFYNPDPLAKGPPMRLGAPALQTALIEQIRQAATDIHATTGLEPASLGNVPELKSGKAIEAQQRMGDRGSYVFSDNLNKSKVYSYEIMGDLMSKIYDTERVKKIVKEDGESEDVRINEPLYNQGNLNEPIMDRQTGQQVIVNDLSQGKYNYTVTTGPAYSTKRKETVDQLITLTENSPIIQELALDLIIKNMDLNNGDEIRTRVRKYMIQKGMVEPTPEEAQEMGLDQPAPPDPMQEALIGNLQAQTEQLLVKNQEVIAKVENLDADTQKKIMESQKATVDAMTSLIETLIKKIDAGIPITDSEAEIIEGQAALVEEVQGDAMEMQQIGGSLPMNAKQQVLANQEPVQPSEPLPGNIPGVVIPGPNEV
jgi:hypothetical protein